MPECAYECKCGCKYLPYEAEIRGVEGLRLVELRPPRIRESHMEHHKQYHDFHKRIAQGERSVANVNVDGEYQRVASQPRRLEPP